MRWRSHWRARFRTISLPHTPAYREIWLDGERIAGGEEEVVEPIYGKTYLPRKFKVVVAVPPSNDVDMFAHDLGYIAIIGRGRRDRGLERHGRRRHGHDPWRAGHLSAHRRRHGLLPTPTRVAIAEAVVTMQRDWGDRDNRKHARLKYTIEDRGLDDFRAEVEKRAGVKLRAAASRYSFTSTGDRYGWSEGDDGRGHLTLFVQNGRVAGCRLGLPSRSALRNDRRACTTGDFRITPNQNSSLPMCRRNSRPKSSASRARQVLLAPWVRPATQFDGLCCAPDLRLRACRKRTLPAGFADRP